MEHRHYDPVLETLAELREDTKALRVELHQLHVEIEKLKLELKLRSGLWGLIAGAIPAAVAILYSFLS